MATEARGGGGGTEGMALSPSQGRPPGLHPALSTRQGFALLEEAGSVRNLLHDSVEAIRSLRFVSLHGEGMLPLDSIGVEKARRNGSPPRPRSSINHQACPAMTHDVSGHC